MPLVEYMVATAVALGAIGVVATLVGALWERVEAVTSQQSGDTAP